MASGGAHVRAEAAERHIHHHAHLTSSLHPVKPAQFAFTVSRESDHDSILGYEPSPRPAVERLDLSYSSNGRPLIRSLSAHSPLKKNFLDLRIVSDEDHVPDGGGMDMDELDSHFRGWSFEKGNVKMTEGREGASTRVSVSNNYVSHFPFILRLPSSCRSDLRLALCASCQVDLRAVRGGGCPASTCQND